MSQNQTLKLEIIADANGLKTELKDATGGMVMFGNKGKQATTKVRKGVQSISTQLQSTKAEVKAFVAAWASIEGIKAVKSLLDEQTNLRTAIRRTIDSQDQFNERQQTLLGLANRTRSDMGATTNLFLKMREPMDALGKSTDDTLNFIELFQKSLKKYPTSAGQASASILQLGQAIGSNNFAGDEFKSLSENAQGFMEALAAGVAQVTGATRLTISDLKKMGAEGKLTTDLVVAALSTQAAQIEKSFNSAEKTIDDSLQAIKNNITTKLGNLDAGVGFGANIRDGIFLINDNLDLLGNTAISVFALIAARQAGASSKMISKWAAETAASTASAQAQIANNVKIATSEKTKQAAILKTAQLEQKAAAANMAVVRANVRATGSTTGYDAAKKRLIASNRALVVAEGKAALATNAYAAATVRASVVSRGLAGASTLLSGGLALIGGPAGLALLAAGAIFTYRKEIGQTIFGVDTLAEADKRHTQRLAEVRKATIDVAHATNARTVEIRKNIHALVDQAKAELQTAKAKVGSARAELQDGKTKRGGQEYTKLKAAIKERNQQLAQLGELSREMKKFDLSVAAVKVEKTKVSSSAEIKRLTDLRNKVKLTGLEYYKLSDAYKNLTGDQKKQALALFKEAELLRNSKKASGARAKSGKSDADKLITAYNKEIKALEGKGNKLSQTAEGYERTRLKAMGFKDAQIESAIAIWKNNQALKSQSEIKEETLQKAQALKQAFEQEMAALKDQTNVLSLTEAAYFKSTLEAKNFTESQVKQALAIWSTNKALRDQQAVQKAFSDEKSGLQDKLNQLQQTAEAYYRATQASKGFSESQIAELEAIRKTTDALEKKKAKEKAFDSDKKGLEQKIQQLSMTELAYYRLTLANKGFTDAQIEELLVLKQTAEGMEAAQQKNAAFAKSFEDDLLASIKKGKLDFSSFADHVIDEILRMYVLKPLMDSLFGQQTAGGGSSGGGLIQAGLSLLGFHEGGIAGAGEQSFIRDVPRYHTGIGPGEVAAVIQKTEGVFTQGQMSAMAPVTPIVNAINTNNNSVRLDQNITVKLMNAPAGQEIESQQQTTDSDGKVTVEVMFKDFEGRLINNSVRGRGLAKVFQTKRTA